MIPDFDENGYLPQGIHYATIEEVVKRFSPKNSLRRKSLTSNLIGFVEFLKSFVVGIYIDGGYTTSKRSPSDIDLIVILPPQFNKESPEARRLRGYQLDNKRNRLHIFAYDLTIEEERGYFQEIINWFSHDRNLTAKGIIYLEFSP